MAGQLWLTTKNYLPRLRPLAPLTSPRSDQFALELGEAAQYGQHQAAMRRSGVSPSVSERFKARPFFPDRPEQVQEISCRSRQPIEPGCDQYVAL
jgi:hypothetical protein